jgi:hypothetical protein
MSYAMDPYEKRIELPSVQEVWKFACRVEVVAKRILWLKFLLLGWGFV